jgi:hypothetical protein
VLPWRTVVTHGACGDAENLGGTEDLVQLLPVVGIGQLLAAT